MRREGVSKWVASRGEREREREEREVYLFSDEFFTKEFFSLDL